MQLILSPHIYVTSIKGTQMTALYQLSHLSSPEPLSHFLSQKFLGSKNSFLTTPTLTPPVRVN